MAPRQIELTFEIKPEQVEVRCSFKDLQAEHDDLLLAFREFAQIAQSSDAARTLETPIIARATKYDFVLTGNRLNLEVAWKLDPGEFEQCVTACEEANPRYRSCAWLPLKRCGAGYALLPEVVKGYALARGAQATWPLGSKTLSGSFIAVHDRKTTSAVAAARLFQAAPQRAQRLLAWMEVIHQAFVEWRDPASAQVVSEAPAPFSPELDALAHTYLLRKRLRLIQLALADTGIEVEGELVADGRDLVHGDIFSGDTLYGPTDKRPPQLLANPLPARIAKRLEEAYVVARKDARRAPEAFRTACGGVKSAARTEQVSLCAMIGP